MVNIHSNLRKISYNIKKHKNINFRTMRYKTKMVLLTFIMSVAILVSHSGFGVGLAEPINSNEAVLTAENQGNVEKVSVLEMPKEGAELPPAKIYDGFVEKYIPFAIGKSTVNSIEEEEELFTEADYEESLILLSRTNIDSETEAENMMLLLSAPAVTEEKTEAVQKKTAGENTEAAKKTVTETPLSEKKASSAKKTSAALKLERNYNAKMELALSKNEVAILFRIVEAEATGEDIYGRMLVANVVINRMHSKQFPDTIKGVVFQEGQFAPVRDGRYESVEISKKTKEAVNRVLTGEDYSKGALYFFARSKTGKTKAKWFDSNLEKLFQYGGHEFYIEK